MIDKLFKDILKKITFEIRKEENKNIFINDIFNPIFKQIKLCFYPYILIIIFIGILIILFNLILIIIILNHKKNI